MNHMILDDHNAPWWDDYTWGECEICEGAGFIFMTNGCKVCPHCDGRGEIKYYK